MMNILLTHIFTSPFQVNVTERVEWRVSRVSPIAYFGLVGLATIGAGPLWLMMLCALLNARHVRENLHRGSLQPVAVIKRHILVYHCGDQTWKCRLYSSMGMCKAGKCAFNWLRLPDVLSNCWVSWKPLSDWTVLIQRCSLTIWECPFYV